MMSNSPAEFKVLQNLSKQEVSSLSQLEQIANQLAKCLQPGQWISLEGPLGSGKTTFCQQLIKALGYSGYVKSPTFSLVEQYPLPERGHILHCDFYRLCGSLDIEILEILEEAFLLRQNVLIEWASQAGVLPKKPEWTIHLSGPLEGNQNRFIAVSGPF